MRRSPICQSPMPVRRLGSRSSSMYRPQCRTNGVLRGPNRIRFPILVAADGPSLLNCAALWPCVISDPVGATAGRYSYLQQDRRPWQIQDRPPVAGERALGSR